MFIPRDTCHLFFGLAIKKYKKNDLSAETRQNIILQGYLIPKISVTTIFIERMLKTVSFSISLYLVLYCTKNYTNQSMTLLLLRMSLTFHFSGDYY